MPRISGLGVFGLRIFGKGLWFQHGLRLGVQGLALRAHASRNLGLWSQSQGYEALRICGLGSGVWDVLGWCARGVQVNGGLVLGFYS